MMTPHKSAWLLAALLLQSGCVTAYHRPETALPARYAHAPAVQTVPGPDGRWWRAFGDPQLDDLVDKALATNRGLASAALAVRNAELLAGIDRMNRLPTVSGGLSASHTEHVSSYTADLSVSYDVDLWRRLASAAAASQWEARATAEDREAVRLALIGAVLNLYWDTGYTRQQIATGEATLAYQRRVLELVTTQYRLGAVSGVERAEATQVVTQQIAALTLQRQHLVEDRAAMALLLGEAATTGSDELATLPERALPEIQPGVPARLLSRRPDVKAAELRLRKTLALGDATRAELYPDLSLTGSGTATSTELGRLFSHPMAAVLGALTLPFLDYPHHRLNDRVAETNYAVAVLGFKTTLFQALRDVDNTLSNRSELAAQGVALQGTLTSAQTAARLYGLRYNTGAVALRIWLDAQQSARTAETAHQNNRLAQLQNQTALYQALGGGAE